ncbi:MAG: hypothetical protein CME05_09905 [Gemmatimonadaceae bacterium]|nr:hypothetical protein [Gemmatimonadaceae bacterium]
MTDRSLAARLEAWLNPLPTCALMAGLQLDVFTHLSRRPSTASEIAAALGVDERRLSQLLRALSAVDLLHISLDEETAPGDSHRACKVVYHAGEEVTAIRTGKAQGADLAGHTNEHERAHFHQELFGGAQALGHELVRRGWLDGCHRVVDAGGGTGGLALAVSSATEAEMIVLERASVVGLAQQAIDDHRVPVSVTHGDVCDPEDDIEQRLRLPVDAVLGVAFLQVLGPSLAAAAVRRMVRWLRSSCLLSITGIGIIDNDRRSPAAAAVADVLFDVLYEEGRTYTIGQITAWMEDAGLAQVTVDRQDDDRLVLRGWRSA